MIISLTAIALSNSLGDYFSTTSLAKGNMPYTSISGIYGGQLFNLLFSFGSGLVIACLSNGGSIYFPLLPHGDTLPKFI